MTRIPRLERDYYPVLTGALESRGILAFHPYDSRRSAEGFPDFTIPIGRWLLFAELKLTAGRLRPEQATWLLALRGPWRASFLVDVAELDSLLLAVDNMKSGRLDQIGPAGVRKVLVLGDVRALGPLGDDADGERVRRAASSAAGRSPTPPPPPRRCIRRRRFGS